jgi:hypothetical protein
MTINQTNPPPKKVMADFRRSRDFKWGQAQPAGHWPGLGMNLGMILPANMIFAAVPPGEFEIP